MPSQSRNNLPYNPIRALREDVTKTMPVYKAWCLGYPPSDESLHMYIAFQPDQTGLCPKCEDKKRAAKKRTAEQSVARKYETEKLLEGLRFGPDGRAVIRPAASSRS